MNDAEYINEWIENDTYGSASYYMSTFDTLRLAWWLMFRPSKAARLREGLEEGRTWASAFERTRETW